MKISELEMENVIVRFVDEVKDFVSLDAWDKMLFDFSKNDILVLWMLFRQSEVNMSQIAEYIDVPLNTATGIVARLEKRNLVIRKRSEQDKRVVTIHLTENGVSSVRSVMKEMSFYAVQLMSAFSPEEMELFFRMIEKAKEILKNANHNQPVTKKIRKITIE